MKLEDFLRAFPKICLANQKNINHNQNILNFYNSIPMREGSLIIQLKRKNDFFKLLRYRTKSFFIFFIENKRQVEMLLTTDLYPVLIEGREKFVGYLSDLRGKGKRNFNNIFVFTKFISTLLSKSQEIDEFKDCDFFISAITD